jgi:glycine/D-amino acid oxidase-like deaminating enzyme
MPQRAEVVICGAGIAGAAVAWHLAVRHGIGAVLVDERAPLSLTSDKSTEAYRNWWPGPDDAMVRFMNRSIDGLEAIAAGTANRIGLNRRGYAYATADPARVEAWRAAASLAEAQGAGALRVHRNGGAAYHPASAQGWEGGPDGADLLLDPELVQRHFPGLAADTCAVLHARRCGWFSGQQLGMHYLEEATSCGARLVRGRVTGIETRGGRVHGVQVDVPGGRETFETERCVLAAAR